MLAGWICFSVPLLRKPTTMPPSPFSFSLLFLSFGVCFGVGLLVTHRLHLPRVSLGGNGDVQYSVITPEHHDSHDRKVTIDVINASMVAWACSAS